MLEDDDDELDDLEVLIDFSVVGYYGRASFGEEGCADCDSLCVSKYNVNMLGYDELDDLEVMELLNCVVEDYGRSFVLDLRYPSERRLLLCLVLLSIRSLGLSSV